MGIKDDGRGGGGSWGGRIHLKVLRYFMEKIASRG